MSLMALPTCQASVRAKDISKTPVMHSARETSAVQEIEVIISSDSLFSASFLSKGAKVKASSLKKKVAIQLTVSAMPTVTYGIDPQGIKLSITRNLTGYVR